MSTIWAGLSIGAIYALIALGYSVVYATSGVFNLAHAQLVTVGTFVAFVGIERLQLPPLVVVGAAMVFVAAIGIGQERLTIRLARPSAHDSALLATLGFAIGISGVVLAIFGPDPKPVRIAGAQQVVTFLNGRLQPPDIALIVTAVVLALVIDALSSRTLWGLASLATSEDREAASLRGINVGRLSTFAFGLAGAMAGLTGLIASPKTFAIFNLGDGFAVKSFVAMALFGFGSPKGALIGGLATGVVDALISRYLGAEYSYIVIFLILLAVLSVRPRGLFNSQTQRAV